MHHGRILSFTPEESADRTGWMEEDAGLFYVGGSGFIEDDVPGRNPVRFRCWAPTWFELGEPVTYSLFRGKGGWPRGTSRASAT